MIVDDVVLINMPANLGKAIDKKSARREFNHKIARITDVVGDMYKLNVDGGRFLWPGNLLAKPVMR